MTDTAVLLPEIVAAARRAGDAILAVYRTDFDVERKADESPVTQADLDAERIILEVLRRLTPDIPVVAEEEVSAGRTPDVGDRFWLVDPLDGTREFISRNGEFTVNIALVEGKDPVAGCVYVPALNALYLAGEGAYRASVEPGELPPALTTMQKLATKPYPAEGLRAMASRSHLDAESEALLRRLPVVSWKPAGSSLKFCLIAQGDGDVYPRLAPTMEWDTAAGQAVLTAAGGCVIGRDGAPLRYGKEGFRNTGFVAWGRAPLA
jgi:3'(2'), 5'-bisphosphate nucleotidase